MENNEEVEVVYSMNSIWQVLVILVFGVWVGFICGMGASFGRIETVALEKPRIDGNITIHPAGKPITISGFYIDMSGKDQPAISIK